MTEYHITRAGFILYTFIADDMDEAIEFGIDLIVSHLMPRPVGMHSPHRIDLDNDVPEIDAISNDRTNLTYDDGTTFQIVDASYPTDSTV